METKCNGIRWEASDMRYEKHISLAFTQSAESNSFNLVPSTSWWVLQSWTALWTVCSLLRHWLLRPREENKFYRQRNRKYKACAHANHGFSQASRFVLYCGITRHDSSHRGFAVSEFYPDNAYVIQPSWNGCLRWAHATPGHAYLEKVSKLTLSTWLLDSCSCMKWIPLSTHRTSTHHHR